MFGQNILTAFDSGLASGREIADRRKRNALAEIFKQAYEAPTPETTSVVPTGSDVYGQHERMITTPGGPGGFNYNNAMAMMMEKGFGPEALQMQQQKDASDISNMMKMAQINQMGAEAPKTRQVPFGDGQIRTEQWNAKTRQWEKVDEGKRAPLVQIGDKGFQKADEKYAEDYVSWTTGGFADTQKGITQLNDAIGQLKSSPEALTGAWVGNVPDVGLQFINPQAIAVREAVEEVVQRSLRTILGAQFTEKESERLIARAFNPRLSPQENIKRVERLTSQLQAAAEAKQQAADYFNKNGTLKGYKGKTYVMSDFNPDKQSGTQPNPKQDAQPEYTQKDLEYTAMKHGITVDEVKRQLGVE